MYIKKTHEIKKILKIKLIFHYQNTRESYLFINKNERELIQMRAEKMNQCLTFYFIFSKTRIYARLEDEYNKQ